MGMVGGAGSTSKAGVTRPVLNVRRAGFLGRSECPCLCVRRCVTQGTRLRICMTNFILVRIPSEENLETAKQIKVA